MKEHTVFLIGLKSSLMTLVTKDIFVSAAYNLCFTLLTCSTVEAPSQAIETGIITSFWSGNMARLANCSLLLVVHCLSSLGCLPNSIYGDHLNRYECFMQMASAHMWSSKSILRSCISFNCGKLCVSMNANGSLWNGRHTQCVLLWCQDPL